jgi:hypothetical protein
MNYRNFTIDYRPKPVPTTALDWQFCADGYDGPGDGREHLEFPAAMEGT